jgi:uncharacterized membrane protein YfhO
MQPIKLEGAEAEESKSNEAGNAQSNASGAQDNAGSKATATAGKPEPTDRKRKIASVAASYGAAFAVPFLILLVTFATLSIYPFGDLSVMLYDMPVQYVNYFGWLHEVLHGQADLFYSNAASLGGGTFSLFTYYLSSPFNLLAFFFDGEHTPELFSLLYLVKIPFCALTCLFCLRGRLLAPEAETFRESRSLAAAAPWQAQLMVVVVSCAYSLTSYVLGYATNIMWLDGVYMLPLATLATWRLLQRGRCTGLFVAALCAVVFNWYTGYMVCLWCVLFFLYELARNKHFAGRRLRLCGRFAATLAPAVIASLIVLLPTALSLLGGKGESAGLATVFGSDPLTRSPLILPNLFFIGVRPGIVMSVPRAALVVSTLALVGCGMLFANSSVSRRSRICAGVLLAIMLASTLSTAWKTIWSGFVNETSYFNRNGFVILFLICLLAAEGILRLRTAKKPLRAAFVGGGVVVTWFVISAGAYFLTRGNLEVSAINTVLEIFLLAAFTGALAVPFLARGVAGRRGGETDASEHRPKAGKTALAVSCVIICALFLCEQVYDANKQLENCQYTVSFYEQSYSEMQEFYGPLYAEQDAGEYVRLGNTSVYWGSSKYNGADNMALALGISSFDHYSSTQQTGIQELLEHLSYSKTTPFGTCYMSTNPIADSLLAVNYIADDTQPYGCTALSGTDSLRGEYSLYRNDLALPLGWGCAGTSSVSWSADDPFANQQAVLNDAAGTDEAVWKAATVADADAASTADAASASSRNVAVTAQSSGPLYIYFPTLMALGLYYDGGIACDIEADGHLVQTIGGRGSCNVVYIGNVEAGQTVTLKITPKSAAAMQTYADGTVANVANRLLEPAASEVVNAQVLDTDAFSRQLSRVDSAGFSLNSYENGYVSANFIANNDELLVFAIPYEDGWTATVNGQQAQVEAAYDGLCAVPVSTGSNDVELRYQTPGLAQGAVAFVLAVTLFGVWRIVARRRTIQLTASN